MEAAIYSMNKATLLIMTNLPPTSLSTMNDKDPAAKANWYSSFDVKSLLHSEWVLIRIKQILELLTLCQVGLNDECKKKKRKDFVSHSEQKTFFVLNFYVHIRCGWFSFKKGYQKGIEMFTCIYLIMYLSKKYMSLC